MHIVRAYTFDFCSFLSVAYRTLNKLFAFFIHYICGFTKEFIALGSLASNGLPYCRLCVKFGANPLNIGRVTTI